jgi:hypothetical protein
VIESGRYEETMAFNNRERRRYPRIIINLPLEYREKGDSCLRGGIVINAGEGGFLIESTRDIPVGTELSITVLFPKGYRLDDFKVVARIVWKKPYGKEDSQGNQSWGGYRYGLEFVQMSDEDRWKLTSVIGGRFEFEEILPSVSCQL